jgi:polysaccharide biosynthesis transport protein
VQQDSEALSPRQVLAVLWRRLPLILTCVAVAAGAAYGFSKRQAKKYTATASIVFDANSLSQQIAGLSPGSTSSSSLLAEQANNVELVKGGDTAEKTARLLSNGPTAAQIADSVSVVGQPESNVVDVSATSGRPVLAAKIANTYVRQFVAEQQAANRQYFKSALALVRKQLATLTPQQRSGPDGVQLQYRAQTLSLLEELNYGNAQLGQEASVPASPSSPKTSKNALLGMLLGLLIGLALAFALDRSDRCIRAFEDFEAIYRVPVLGVVRKVAPRRRLRHHGTGRPTRASPPAETEAFSLIRARLRFFNADRQLRTIVVASAEPDEDRTTVARRLAEAEARFGLRVLLIEGDLRHPMLASELGLQSVPGLADTLLGSASLSDATQQVALEGSPSKASDQRALDALVAGAVSSSDSAELLASYSMEAVLQHAKSAYDLVVIDTPPLTVVSDGFSFLGKVDGIVVVGRLGRSRRDAAEQLRHIIACGETPLLGVIANASSTVRTPLASLPRSVETVPPIQSSNGVAPIENLTSTTKA